MLNYHQLGEELAVARQGNRQAAGWLPSAADGWPAPEELDLERLRWNPDVLRAGLRRPLILVGGFAANGLCRVEEYGGRRYLGQQVWPPFHFHPTSGNWRIHPLSELNRGELVPTGLLIGQYQPLLMFLQQELGYRLDHDLFLFPYCWTESNRTSGRRLAGFIQQVLEARGGEEVDVLSHSMGGLVARVAGLLFGAPLRRCIYLACPFFGAGKAYFNLHPGQTLQLVDNLLLNRLISRFSPETLLNRDQTLRQCFQSWPSLFELLPDGHAFSQGWAPVGRVEYPASESQADIDAARASTMSVDKKNFWSNTWFGDAAVFGQYPEDGLRLFGSEAPRPQPGDMELIAQKLDFYGLNIYSGGRVKAGADGTAVPVWLEQGHARNALSWAVAPESLRWGPRFIAERYKLPVLITENGMSNLDWVHADGAVHDPQRIDYTRRYLLELHKAVADGADIRGYFHWSIMDNFEWAEGYKDRFGLIHVDFATLKRTLKDSAHWYAEVIASNGGVLATPHAGLDRSLFVYEGAAV